ncbi:hypothetical protein Tco_1227877 [Tanacetum coccineum]
MKDLDQGFQDCDPTQNSFRLFKIEIVKSDRDQVNILWADVSSWKKKRKASCLGRFGRVHQGKKTMIYTTPHSFNNHPVVEILSHSTKTVKRERVDRGKKGRRAREGMQYNKDVRIGFSIRTTCGQSRRLKPPLKAAEITRLDLVHPLLANDPCLPLPNYNYRLSWSKSLQILLFRRRHQWEKLSVLRVGSIDIFGCTWTWDTIQAGKTRPTGTAPFSEANVATYNDHSEGLCRGHDRGRGRGFGRGQRREFGKEANSVYDNDAHDILDDLTGPTDATIEGVHAEKSSTVLL